MTVDPSVVLVTPLMPAPTGNGLAMRAGMLLEALAAAGPVDLMVVPVAGGAEERGWAEARARSVHVVPPVVDDAQAREHVIAQLADPRLRARLEAAAPLPHRATLAPPTLAPRAAITLGPDSPDAVLTLRLYLAPFGIELGRILGARRAVIDVDDDDEMLLRALGDPAEADACGRLARAWLPEADGVMTASPDDSAAVRERYGLATVDTVPNAVQPIADAPRGPGSARLLFVGNLTYRPNLDAAEWFVTEVLPRVRSTRPDATVDLVGPHLPGALDDLAAGVGVRVHGRVEDVAASYAATDVVVAPLLHGSGTRIKVLEAFAHRRPVVSTTAAAAGLGVQDGVELVIADGADAFAAAVVALLGDAVRAVALVEVAAATLARRFAPAVVAPLVRAAVLGRMARGEAGLDTTEAA